MVHAKNPVIQEAVAAALGGDAIPLIDRDVYYAASEMQLLENGIRRVKDKLAVLIGADNNGTSRRKEGKAVWEKTKESAKKEVDTGLLQELCAGTESRGLGAGDTRATREPPIGAHGAEANDRPGSIGEVKTSKNLG
jgi:hypothetical protein